MSAMPTSVQIGPYRYTVLNDKVSLHAENQDANQVFSGRIHLRGGKIFVDPVPPTDYQRETLLHEVLHGILHYGYFADLLDGEKTETLISRLSPLLIDTLRRNPALMQYLTAEDV